MADASDRGLGMTYGTGIEEKTFCPLGAKCVEAKGDVIHRCEWHTPLRGPCPNTGELIDKWGCAIRWFPLLLIENTQKNRETGAAIETFRNEMVEANKIGQQVLLATAKNLPQLINNA